MSQAAQAPSYPVGSTRVILVATAIICALLELIDATVVNVALREISGNIGATLTEIAWVVTSYSIANVIMIPLSAMMSSLLGRKLYFTLSVVVFTVSSLMCGLSDSLWTLVFWRFVQGIGGGGLLTTAQSIIIGAFPPEKMGLATAIYGLGIILGPTLGPSLGGYIVDHYAWNTIFFINVPIGILAAFFSWRFVPNLFGESKPKKIDFLGIALLILFIGPLQYVLEEGASKDWFNDHEILFLFVLSMVSMIGFVWRELSIDYPAVDIRLYKNYNLAMGSFLNIILGMILFGSVFMFPVFVQSSLGWTATKTGNFMIPGALATAVGMISIGKISKGKNPKIFIIIGVLLTFSFLAILSRSSADATEWNFFFPFILRGIGMAFMMMPIMQLALSGLSGKELAQASGLSNMMRQLGGAIGIALINLYLNDINAEARSNMVQNISDYNAINVERVNMFTQNYLSQGFGTEEARNAAYQMMEFSLFRQQQVIGFTQGFLAVGFCVLLCIPLVFLIRYRKPQKGEELDMSSAH